ncbi:MAG: 4-hydroxy-tetrahydrodipicolinate reductase [Bacteroidota bacterium]
MNIAIIGYGRMGQTIERLAKDGGHHITGIIDIDTSVDHRLQALRDADVAIEFSNPAAALSNILECINNQTPVVSGTTGWLDQLSDIEKAVEEREGSFFYASNYSIGVNLFFAINERMAALLNGYPSYNVEVTEVHHIHKKDAPSGTAITTAEGIISHLDRKGSWTMDMPPAIDELTINARREGEIYGIHEVSYASEIDTIKLYHEAHTRDGFAQGAILAASWLVGKKGVYGMKDLLGI